LEKEGLTIMKKYIITFSLIFTFSLSADGHSNVKPGEETGEFHYFNVTNPAKFVKAIDEHYASDCAAKWQKESGAEVVLMQVLGSTHSHFIYVGYKNNDMLEKGRQLFRSCKESAKMIAKLNMYSEPSAYVSRLGEQSLEVGDWTTDNHFMKFDFNVALGKASVYASEWTKMMNSLEQTNSAGLITHRAGSGWISHFVYVGGNSIDDLYSTFDANSQTDSFQNFAKNVSSIRELRNVSLLTPVKAYPSKR
jgi:virulence-associated protein VapD